MTFETNFVIINSIDVLQQKCLINANSGMTTNTTV
jgi:hypothetical protein